MAPRFPFRRRPAPAFHARYGPFALVTGASDGIGRAFAEALAAAGFGLVLVARRADRLDALAAELGARHGTEALVVACDLARPESIATIAARTAALDVGLVVAAAGFGTSGRFLDGDIERDLGMIDVNCRAVAGLAHHFGRRMWARGRGGIVLLSSLVAFQGVPRMANYAATKAFVQGLAEGLRDELRGDGIDVLAIAPGPIASGFAARAGLSMGMSQAPAVVARGALAALTRAGTVRPGWLAKLLEGALWPLPRRLRTLVMGRVAQGMTR